MKTITVEIKQTGEVVIETAGFKGDACVKATAAIEKALGVGGARKKKSEFYQVETKSSQQIGGKR